MYLISNQQYDDVMEMLTAYAGSGRPGESLKVQNLRRRARLLLKQLMKRKPIGKANINIINN